MFFMMYVHLHETPVIYQHQFLKIILGVYFQLLQTVWKIIEYLSSLNFFTDVTSDVTSVKWWLTITHLKKVLYILYDFQPGV